MNDFCDCQIPGEPCPFHNQDPADRTPDDDR